MDVSHAAAVTAVELAFALSSDERFSAWRAAHFGDQTTEELDESLVFLAILLESLPEVRSGWADGDYDWFSTIGAVVELLYTHDGVISVDALRACLRKA